MIDKRQLRQLALGVRGDPQFAPELLEQVAREYLGLRNEAETLVRNWNCKCVGSADKTIKRIANLLEPRSPHVDSGEVCLVVHYDDDGNQLGPCTRCATCRRWIPDGHMNEPCEAK